MNTRTLQLTLLLMAIACGARAQTGISANDASPARPMNLSARKAPVGDLEPATAAREQGRQLRLQIKPDPSPTDDAAVTLLPYGAGFDSRLRSGGADSGTGSAGASGNGGGSGGGGGGGGSGGGGGGGRGGR